MSTTLKCAGALRLQPLAACLIAAFALADPAAAGSGITSSIYGGRMTLPSLESLRAGVDLSGRPLRHPASAQAKDTPAPRASTITVANCADDGGAGTLRQAVLTASSGDTVDLSGLACSAITLQSGAIMVNVADLTIQGPGVAMLAIDGNQADRVFQHSGAGTLALADLSVTHGKLVADKAYGGCIFSSGNVSLTRSAVSSCMAAGQAVGAGGGVVTIGNLSLDASTLSDNLADAAVGATGTLSAVAGGAFVHQQLTLQHSIVSGNTVHAAAGQVDGGGMLAYSLTSKYSSITGNKAVAVGDVTTYSVGGGAAVISSVFMLGSTLDHNQADIAGGLFVGNSGSGFATVVQSTVSSNKGNLEVGGIGSSIDLSLSGSTIAFNTAGPFGGGGLAVAGNSAILQSSIMANNLPADLDGGAAFTGANNLVKVVGPNTTAPPNTISQDPALGPLAHNGGATRTHAPGSGSPAVDAGNNVSNLGNDQRGAGFSRVVGMAADIGAVEVDPNRLFTDGFDVP